MSNVYFEAMEFHELERRNRMDEHRDGYDKWAEESIDTYEYVQKLVEQGLPLGKEELEFLMRHAAENIYLKAETAEHHFFAHHFDRVDRKRKADQESARKDKVIDEYSRALKNIATTGLPTMFGVRNQLMAVKQEAGKAIERGQMYV